jgi:hypothetical protein
MQPMAQQAAEKLDLELGFGWRQRFSAAITGLFSVAALAAEVGRRP